MTIPEIGAECEPHNLVCAYERCFDTGRPDVVFICNAGSFFYDDRWDCERNPPDCPECLPTDGEVCGEIGLACRYGTGIKAGCHADGWWIWDVDRYSL